MTGSRQDVFPYLRHCPGAECGAAGAVEGAPAVGGMRSGSPTATENEISP